MNDATATNNLAFIVPLPDDEVAAIVKSVWKYKLSGNLKQQGQKFAALDCNEFQTLLDKPRAFQLLAYLKLHNDGLRPEFFVADASIAATFKCSKDTIEAARWVLLERGFLKRTYQGGKGKGDASRYCFV